MIDEYALDLLNKLSKKSRLSVEEIVRIFVNKQLANIFPRNYVKTSIKVKPNKVIDKAAKALKISEGEVLASLLTSWVRSKKDTSNVSGK